MVRRPTCGGDREGLHPRPLAGSRPLGVRPCCAQSSLAAGEEGTSAPPGLLGREQGPGRHTALTYGRTPGGRAPPRCEPVPPTPERPREAQPGEGEPGALWGPELSAAHRSEAARARRPPRSAAPRSERAATKRGSVGTRVRARAGAEPSPDFKAAPPGPLKGCPARGRGSRSETAFPAPSPPERPGQASPQGP